MEVFGKSCDTLQVQGKLSLGVRLLVSDEILQLVYTVSISMRVGQLVISVVELFQSAQSSHAQPVCLLCALDLPKSAGDSEWRRFCITSPTFVAWPRACQQGMVCKSTCPFRL